MPPAVSLSVWDTFIQPLFQPETRDHLRGLTPLLTPRPHWTALSSHPPYVSQTHPLAFPSPLPLLSLFLSSSIYSFKNTDLILSLFCLKSFTTSHCTENIKTKPKSLFGCKLSGFYYNYHVISCLPLPRTLHPKAAAALFFSSFLGPALKCLRCSAHAVPSVWSVPSPFGLSLSLSVGPLRSLFFLSSLSLDFFSHSAVFFPFQHFVFVIVCLAAYLISLSLIRPLVPENKDMSVV